MNILPVNTITPPLAQKAADSSSVSQAKQNFSDFIKTNVAEVTQAQNEGDSAIEKLYSGEAQNLHEVMISVEQADISLRMLVQIRNKALQAYEEIMRIQV